MNGHPHYLHCPVARRYRALNGHWPATHNLTRTGRVRPNRSTRRQGISLPEAHEYVCSCGHAGWTTHPRILNRPVAEEQTR